MKDGATPSPTQSPGRGGGQASWGARGPLASRAPPPPPGLASMAQAAASHSNIYPCFIFQKGNEEKAIGREGERRENPSFSFES